MQHNFSEFLRSNRLIVGCDDDIDGRPVVNAWLLPLSAFNYR